MLYLLPFLIGVLSGLRAMTPLAVASWAARAGRLSLGSTFLAFLGYAATPYLLTLLALGELIADKLPQAPSRKAPLGFSGRIITGALTGGALGATLGSLPVGLLLGALGAIAGTLGGYEFRTRLVKATSGRDLPIALLEDAITILGSIWIAYSASA